MELLADIYVAIVFLIWTFIGFQWCGSFKEMVGIVSDGCLMQILLSVLLGCFMVMLSIYKWFLGIPLIIIGIILMIKIIKKF